MLAHDLITTTAVLAQAVASGDGGTAVPGAAGGANAGANAGVAGAGSGWLALQGCLLLLALVATWVLWKRDVLRPGSFTRLGRRERLSVLGPGDELLWLGLAGGVFVCGVLLAVLSQVLVPMLGPADDLQRSVMTLALSTGPLAAGALTLWLLFATRAGCGVTGQTQSGAAGVMRRGMRGAIWGLIRGAGLFAIMLPMLLVLSAAATWLVTRMSGQTPPGIVHTTLSMIVTRRDDPWTWALVALVVLAVPVVEEVLYRGLLQTALVQMTGSTWIGIGTSSVAFVAVHFGSVPPGQFAFAVVPLGVLSVAMGIALERTRSLSAPIVMHMLFNAANVALAVLSA